VDSHDTAQRQNEVRRGELAQQVSDNEVFQEAFDTLEQQYTEALLNSAPGQTEDRERLYMAIQALRMVRGHVQTTMETGRMARKQLDELRAGQERKRGRFGL
jgi:hypothetical protein